MSKIKVYAAKTDVLNDDALYAQLYGSVSKRRQEKADSLMSRNSKNLSVAAEYLLMYAAHKFGIKSFDIKYGNNGKPYLSGEKLYFNLSHSGQRVMCAFGESEVGCDVEKIKAVNPKTVRRCLCDAEYDAFLRCGSETEKTEMFFRLWTLKESFMKAVGLGMKLPPDSFCIDISGTAPVVYHEVNRNTYYLREYDMGDGYKYASCGTGPQFDDIEFVEIK